MQQLFLPCCLPYAVPTYRVRQSASTAPATDVPSGALLTTKAMEIKMLDTTLAATPPPGGGAASEKEKFPEGEAQRQRALPGIAKVSRETIKDRLDNIEAVLSVAAARKRHNEGDDEWLTETEDEDEDEDELGGPVGRRL